MGMLKAVPKHWFSWDFRLDDAVAVPWGEVTLSSWRERGPNGELAKAVKVSAFKREFRLAVDGR